MNRIVKRKVFWMKAFIFSVFMLAMVRVSLANVHAEPQSKHRVTVDDLEHFGRTESVVLSPDGAMLAYTVENTGEENLGLWLIDTRQGSRPRKIADGRFPVWAPDGKQLAYFSRESGSLQLWEFDLSSGQKVQLSRLKDGIMPDQGTVRLGYSIYEAVRYSWSPDSSKIVFSSQIPVLSIPTSAVNSSSELNVKSRESPVMLTGQTPTEWTLAGVFSEGTTLQREWHNGKQDNRESESTNDPAKVDQLFVVNVVGKTTAQLTSGNLGYFSPDWSPDGSQIVCISSEGHALESYWVHTNLHLVSALDGRDKAMTSDQMYKHTPSWSPDGRWISYIATDNELVSKVSLMVLPKDGGKAIDATSKLDRRVFDAHWLPDSKTMMVNYMDGVDWPVARLDVMSRRHVVVSGPEAASRGFTFAVSRSGVVAWTQDDPTNPGVIRVLRDGARESYVLVDLNPQIENWDLPKQEVVRWKTRHGQERQGFLLKPVGYQEGKHYPLIIDAYPSQVNAFKASPMEGNIAWATKGYVVFWPDAEAPHTWPNPFLSVRDQEGARGVKGLDLMFDDVMSGVDHLISDGLVDPDRMCLYGFSSGGGVVNQLVTMTDRFKCAVSVSAALSADWVTPFFLQTNARFIADIAGVTPWQDPVSYIRLSAIYRLDRVHTPMLLADGAADTMFLIGCIEMYNGLRFLGKDVTFLRYPGQGHGFQGAAMKDFWNRENSFFEKYLTPEK